MIQIPYELKRGELTLDILVRISDVSQARNAETSAPWDVKLTILWGEEVAFQRALAGMDPLHAVYLAAQFAAQYIHGRAEDERGTLDPPIHPFLEP